jgi:uncharacterized membrane protein YeaQ/YmgE (transglycosylase-associated protein family)
MEKLAVFYAGTDLGHMAIWLLLATAAGFGARKIVRGKSVLGFWGDAAFGLLGVFLIGTLLNAFNLSISSWIAGLNLGPLDTVAYWVDVAVVAFLGALLIRGILRPVTG